MADTGSRLTVAEVESVLGERTGYTVLLFTTPTCATCGPVRERLARLEAAGQVRALTCDVTLSPELADHAGILSVPTVQIYAGAELLRVAVGTACLRALRTLEG